MSFLEILLLLVVALIVIPPDRLPEVMRTVGKILRELRLASNTIVREISGAVEDPTYMSDRSHNNPMATPWSAGSKQPEPDKQPSAAEPPSQT